MSRSKLDIVMYGGRGLCAYECRMHTLMHAGIFVVVEYNILKWE